MKGWKIATKENSPFLFNCHVSLEHKRPWLATAPLLLISVNCPKMEWSHVTPSVVSNSDFSFFKTDCSTKAKKPTLLVFEEKKDRFMYSLCWNVNTARWFIFYVFAHKKTSKQIVIAQKIKLECKLTKARNMERIFRKTCFFWELTKNRNYTFLGIKMKKKYAYHW